MKKLIISILLISVGLVATAQSGYDDILQQIEANNTTLSALRDQMEAQKIGNRTGIFLANPEVEFNYLWGKPDIMGNRKDISIRQSFDFPTAYAYRSKVSDLQNVNAELAYKAERINLLLLAKQLCIDMIYNNALAKEYAVRLQNAERIAATYEVKMNKGDANVIENNKAQLNLSTVQTEMTRIEVERTSLLSQLKSLNGGQEIDFPDDIYPVNVLPPNFEEWYASAEAKSPVLQYVSGQIEIGRQQVKLNRALGLPKFSAGYMSEQVVGERFQGVTLGVSVPLWENKNRVRQAKAQVTASESALADTKVQFYNRLQSLYLKSVALRQNVQKIRQSLSEYSNAPLLQKALDAGEISLLNYLLEIEYYYDAMNRALEAERNYQQAIAELSAVEL
ncbi:TolC family protein [Proteiniphilum saccharofermentans]|uniref:TolC family protein n=1 Tax=Proteiniphilum saccharofermentans TaxID=1642647 RepID=UPI0028A95466|nr:TolC family protein [Proteiniphilum saccharofermentans]